LEHGAAGADAFTGSYNKRRDGSGVSHSASGSGVAGINDASGIAVYGRQLNMGMAVTLTLR
jgi:hypothetical protein